VSTLAPPEEVTGTPPVFLEPSVRAPGRPCRRFPSALAARVAEAAARALLHLRVEEAIALAFLLPTTALTLAANRFALERGILGPRHPGGLIRLAVIFGLLALLAAASASGAARARLAGLREVLPVLICILIYTNLHDTIGFVNGHDVHYVLMALDEMVFGVQPCVWAERLITPLRTEVMSFLYMSFFWIAPSTGLILLARRRWTEFRATALAAVTCFYLGYFLYVLFPAAPPRLVLVYEFSRSLEGYPRAFSNLAANTFALLPVDSRAAFPSLHAAVSLVALVCAWRYTRRWFFALLPFVLGLWVSTIYLRHHYFVDLLAGWALAPVALAAAPRLDERWARWQRARGLEPARGAPGGKREGWGGEGPGPPSRAACSNGRTSGRRTSGGRPRSSSSPRRARRESG
jgi:membrane-associated phospholipid phosphatase